MNTYLREAISPQDEEGYSYYKNISVKDVSKVVDVSRIISIVSNEISEQKIQNTYIIPENTLVLKYYSGLGIGFFLTNESLYLATPSVITLPHKKLISKKNEILTYAGHYCASSGAEDGYRTHIIVPEVFTTPLSNLI